MADNLNTAKKLSHKLFKRLLQKEKRKLRRQKAAEARRQAELKEEERLQNDHDYRQQIEDDELQKEKQEKFERENKEKLWLEREAKAQEEFAQKKIEEERKIKVKEEQEKVIKLEWERQQEKEKLEKEKKEKEIKDKEVRTEKNLNLITLCEGIEKDALFRELEKDVPSAQDRFHNPVAPENYGTEKDVVNCSFYLKTGACRFGERCSRQHPRPSSSTTLLIPSMYNDIRHIESALDIADRDTGLEFDEQDAYKNFLVFYDDVYPEFEKYGRVSQFTVCCNYELHLRGNVYVQYLREEDCKKAFAEFNGRWYAGRQLSCEFSPVTNWKSAICGLFAQNRCPRGKNCNFLHVYRNPDDWSEQCLENRRCSRDENDRREERGRNSRCKNDKYFREKRRSRYDDREYRNDSKRRKYRDKSFSDSDNEHTKKRKRSHRSSNSDDSDYEKSAHRPYSHSKGSSRGKDRRNRKSNKDVDCNQRSKDCSRTPESECLESGSSHRHKSKKRKKRKHRSKDERESENGIKD
ncbi:U2 small nuclear ribonucleoprotein auxiliary factor 35 kDa subunit-related protein 1-like [Xenia sp. Carnegie-2017]|uniref:U2 small nuclear ribonucleoprotein auxiliary factor 35 kDa subunit-related protein 1-like n=1 Tax=Xenia sp. Carnegie-2017 TaxID=2897299 RepID=UPI001F035DC7|nr:U2 small nuclear ribonucleoprotein auxiliary factor 35 kDa subunit-related protein 1-like [Xenia sp. Carnegie-2017]